MRSVCPRTPTAPRSASAVTAVSPTTMSTSLRSCGTEPGLRLQTPDSDTGIVSVRIRRVTTTRAGGVSGPPFDSFNLGDHVGDDPAAVAANRRRLATSIGADAVVWMNQVHGDRVVTVT